MIHPARYVVFGVVAVGSLLALGRAMTAFGRYFLNVGMLGDQLRKLIAANNIDRAIKLCNAAPKPYGVQVLRPLIEAAKQGASETELRQTLLAETERQANTERFGLITAVVVLSTLAVAIAFDWTFPGTPRGVASVIAGLDIGMTLWTLGKASQHRGATLEAAEAVIAGVNSRRGSS